MPEQFLVSKDYSYPITLKDGTVKTRHHIIRYHSKHPADYSKNRNTAYKTVITAMQSDGVKIKYAEFLKYWRQLVQDSSLEPYSRYTFNQRRYQLEHQL